MNVFTLFESDNIDSIKLGIQVVKTLGCEKEFEEKLKVPFKEYKYNFNRYVIKLLNQDSSNRYWLIEMFKHRANDYFKTIYKWKK